MHEKQTRLLGQHVAVQRGDRDVVLFQCGDHRIHFFRRQHEVSRCGNFADAGFLEVDRFGDALGCGQRHSVIGDRRGTRNPEGEHASGKAALVPKVSSMVFTNAGGSRRVLAALAVERCLRLTSQRAGTSPAQRPFRGPCNA